MDPNEVLRRMLLAADACLEASDEGRQPDASTVDDLAEAAKNLDQWLNRGGFLPDRWGTRGQACPHHDTEEECRD